MRGFAPLGRVIGLTLVCAGLGTVTVGAADPAQAATSGGPTAIGVASDGTSFVGFASGGKLIRIGANGKKRGSIALPSNEAVDGLFVTGDNKILVDFATSVAVLNPKGKVLAEFSHSPAKSCGSDHPASRYGGITFGGGRIWVANRCTKTMSVYKRSGSLVATVKLPGGHPRGITFGRAQSGRPATVYVAIPDSGKVLSYRAGSIRNSSKPARTTKIKRPYGGKAPRPGGLVVDGHGQLTVSDLANNALYLLDTNNKFSLYRTLGHPPRASRVAGRLNLPSALAQHAHDGGSLSGNLFIADTSNSRIQRWDTGGYTHWATKVSAGSGGGGKGDCGGDDWNCGGGGGGGGGNGGNNGGDDDGGWGNGGDNGNGGNNGGDDDGGWGNGGDNGGNNGGGNNGGGNNGGGDNGGGSGGGDNGGSSGSTTGPAYSSAPSITGAPSVGSVLACNLGSWYGTSSGGGSISYARQWLRNGSSIGGATNATYTVVATDSGASLSCKVTATDRSGSTTYITAAVTIGGGGSGGSGTGPTNGGLPTITGSTAVGGTLSCSPGAWTGTAPIGYGYQWKRAGAVIPGATNPTYVVAEGDTGTTVTCTVTATNATGSTSATSLGTTIPQSPTISGTVAPGSVVTCIPAGSLPAGATNTYQWRLDGVAIPLATWASYTVLRSDMVMDAANRLTCTVTTTSSSGTTTATSAGRQITPWSGHAPSNDVPPSVSGTPAPGQTLTCAPGAWSGLSDLVTTYKWQRDGADIGSASSSSYVVATGDVGKRLVCVVLVDNGWGKSALATTPVLVTPSAPAVSEAPTIKGAAKIGTALTCDKGTWSGTGLTFAYRWNRGGSTIADTGSSSYVVLNEDATTSLTCTVTATNGTGSVSRTSDPVVVEPTTGNTPTWSAAPSISGTPATGQTLTCNKGTWNATPTPTFLTLWQRDGVTVSNGSTYQLTSADANASVRCVVVATILPDNVVGAARSDAVGGNSCGGSVGVVINGNAASTTSAQVTLSIRPPAGATTVQISNDNDFTGVTPVSLVGSCTYAWTVPAVPGLPTTATVYVKFDAGTPATAQDSINVNVPNASMTLRW